jgi:xanthine/CO dehydrogenase XdhC/CoxF family maturation factor
VKELEQILCAYEEIQSRGGRAVLATIARASGSTYRRPGARMLILERGEPVGLLGGGCLEGDLAERAGSVLQSGRSETVVYDMTTQEDLVWGLGLGCVGMVQVLLERVPQGDGDAARYLEFLSRCLSEGRLGVVASVFRAEGPVGARPGLRMTLDAEGLRAGTVGDPELDSRVHLDMAEAWQTRRTRTREYALPSGAVDVLVEAIEPPVPLVVFGAGSDAVPVVRGARALGWRVTVVDHRPAMASRARLPEADRVVLAAEASPLGDVELGTRTVALVMTHRFQRDLDLARLLVPSPVRYLGFLGPRARTEKILAELEREGLRATDEQLRRVYGPVGLDIGAERPEEIALAALAEIHAVVEGRGGGFLRERRGPLHERWE